MKSVDAESKDNLCPYCDGAGGRGEKCAECNPEGHSPAFYMNPRNYE